MVPFSLEVGIRKGLREVGKGNQPFCLGRVAEVVVGGVCAKWERDRPEKGRFGLRAGRKG